mgnify:CR=1 FL=1
MTTLSQFPAQYYMAIKNSAGGVSYAIPTGGVTQATAGALVAGSSNKCDIQSRQDLFPRQKYDSVNGTGRFEVTDWLTVSLDAFYSKRSFYRRSAYSSASVSVPP